MQKKLEMKIPHTWSELAVSHNFCNLFMKCPIFETRQDKGIIQYWLLLGNKHQPRIKTNRKRDN